MDDMPPPGRFCASENIKPVMPCWVNNYSLVNEVYNYVKRCKILQITQHGDAQTYTVMKLFKYSLMAILY